MIYIIYNIIYIYAFAVARKKYQRTSQMMLHKVAAAIVENLGPWHIKDVQGVDRKTAANTKPAH